MMITKHNKYNYVKAIDGVEYKTNVWGENTSLSEFHLIKGYKVPIHKHIHEQTGYLIKGKLKFYIDNSEYIVQPGDSWNIPSNVAHGVGILEESVVVEVFSPVREDYIPEKLRK